MNLRVLCVLCASAVPSLPGGTAGADDAPVKPRGQIVQVTHDPPDSVPSIGPRYAPVTIEFFVNLGDGALSFNLHRLLVQLQERHPRRLRVLYRLVSSGEQSNPHLEAAIEAFVQGRFREFVDAMYGQRGSPRMSQLAEAAQAAGVDARLVEEAMADARHAKVITANHYYRKRRRLKRVPGLVVNGVPYDKRLRTIEELETLYDEAYARGKALLDSGVAPEDVYPRLVEEALAEQPEPVVGPGAVDGLGPGERPPVGPPPVVTISTEGVGHSRGAERAPVPIVFFCNFQTRNCATTAQTLEEIAAAYPDEVRLVFRHTHDASDDGQDREPALGRASLCAEDQGRFWSFYELAFRRARQGEEGEDGVADIAKALELDGAAFERCTGSRATRRRLESEKRSARAGGIKHTPSLVIGGRLYTGTKSFDDLAALVDRELEPGVLGRLTRE